MDLLKLFSFPKKIATETESEVLTVEGAASNREMSMAYFNI